jgi:hypothetical protein
MLAFWGIAAGLKGLMGWAGVAKAGDEDGIGFKGAGVAGALNIGAARDLSGWNALLIIHKS